MTRLRSGLLGHNLYDTLLVYLESAVVIALLCAIAVRFIGFDQTVRLVPIVSIAVVATQYLVAWRLSFLTRSIDARWNRASAKASFWIVYTQSRALSDRNLFTDEITECYRFHEQYCERVRAVGTWQLDLSKTARVKETSRIGTSEDVVRYFELLLRMYDDPSRHRCHGWKHQDDSSRKLSSVEICRRFVRRVLFVNMAAEGGLALTLCLVLLTVTHSLTTVIPSKSWLGLALPMFAMVGVLLVDEVTAAIRRFWRFSRVKDSSIMLYQQPESSSSL
jgi:hypothetical protein